MRSVRKCLAGAVETDIFPGGVLLVATQDRIRFLESVGKANLYAGTPMTTDTVFDLASLTKPLATTLCAMALVQTGKIGLDVPLRRMIPDFTPTDKADITPRQLLSHTAGLAAYRPYHESLRHLEHGPAKAALRKALLDDPRLAEPGTECLYSDIGFMILEWIMETLTQETLDRLVIQLIYAPLGLEDRLFFNPLPRVRPAPYAATEDCPWRGKVLEGEVHDDNAYVVGGVAGHAGLFGTVEAVFQLLQVLLRAWRQRHSAHVPLTGETVQTFFKRQTPGQTWALGFDTPSRPDSSSGRYFSDRSVGHLGFTGTSFWMDLDREITVILLTNRVHPSRNNERIKSFRPHLHDTVMAALGQ